MKLTARLFCLFVLAFVCAFSGSAQPVITGFSPSSGAVGTPVTISGNGFSPIPAENLVEFGGSKAVVTASTSSSLTVIVPTGFNDGGITVSVNQRTAFSSGTFIVTYPGGSGPFTTNLFAPKQTMEAPGMPQGITINDLDSDNKPELLIVNYSSSTISVYKNICTSTAVSFAPKLDFSTGVAPWSIAVGDIDGDGKKDLVTGNGGSKTISVLRNTSANDALSFADKIDFEVPSTAYIVAINDLNGDGKPEIVASNGENGILVLQNTSVTGAVSFATSVLFSAGFATDIAIGDLNADGKVDLVTLNGSYSLLCVLKNTATNGNIAFADPLFYATDYNPFTVAIGDIDNDGKPDLATGNQSGSLSILKNTGSGNLLSFASAINLRSSRVAHDLILADLNGDGKLDIIFVNDSYTNTITLFRNTSQGMISFADRLDLFTDGMPRGIAVGDLTNSGRLDFAVTLVYDDLVSIFRNKAADPPTLASFTPNKGGQGTIVTIEGNNLSGVSAVSFGGVPAMSFAVVSESKITAMVGAGASGNITVTTPAGTSTLSGFVFQPQVTLTSFTPQSGPVGQRVKITGTNFSANPGGNVVYFGAAKATVNSASSTTLYVTVPSGATFDPVSVTTDNHTAWTKKPFHVTFPDGSLSAAAFRKGTDIFTSYDDGFNDITLADIDGDGKTDVLLNSFPMNCFWVYRNTSQNGLVSFAPRTRVNVAGNHPYSITVSDFDADGKLDVTVANDWSHTINVFRNTSVPGTVSFAAPKTYGVGQYPSQIAVGDLDGDGLPDLAVVNESSPFISIFRNTSSAADVSFGAHQTFSTLKIRNGSLSISDVDGDGRPDIAVTNADDNSFSVFRNISSIGSISLAPRADLPAGTGTSFVTMGDVDGDGKQDLIAAKGYYKGTAADHGLLSIFRNTSLPGTISFGASVDLNADIPNNVVLNDLDGDDKPDIVSCDGNSTVYIYKNKSRIGNIVFEPKVNILAAPYTNPNSVAAGDLDGDGKPDIAATIDNTDQLTVLINQNGSDIVGCLNGNLTIYSNITGQFYQWQVDVGTGFANLLADTIYSGVNTGSLQISKLLSKWSGYKFRCLVNGQYSKVFTLKFVNEWNGSADNTWENPANWSCGSVPDTNADVILHSGIVMINSNVVVRTLRIDPDAGIKVASGFTVKVIQ